jgi:hypothetical protein
MADVFISYAHQDKAFADGRGLEWVLKSKAPELTIWRDDGIAAGAHWSEDIGENLRAAKCVVVIWSRNSWASPWVRQEAFYALMERKLVPMRVDDVVLEPPFNAVQVVLNNAKGYEALVAAIRLKIRS